MRPQAGTVPFPTDSDYTEIGHGNTTFDRGGYNSDDEQDTFPGLGALPFSGDFEYTEIDLSSLTFDPRKI